MIRWKWCRIEKNLGDDKLIKNFEAIIETLEKKNLISTLKEILLKVALLLQQWATLLKSN